MDSIALQVDRLRSPNKVKRYDACEELRLTPRLSPEAILALKQASDDPDPDVADAARRALLVHVEEETDFMSQTYSLDAAPVQGQSVTTDHEVLLKEIRSWGFWSLGLGVLHLIGSGILSAPWGLLLIVVGLASFYFRTASMFIVYGVTMSWAALSNLLGGAGGWNIFALLQVYFAWRLFQQFRRFRKVEEELLGTAPDETETPAFPAERTARLFPWLGLFLGGWSLLGLLGVWAAIVISAGVSQGTANIEFLGLLEGLVVDFGVLGFALALASLLSGYRPKIVAIIGLTAGLLTILLEFGLYFLLL
ncbi:MAG TPA: hypothetical protein VFZ43_05360 [Anaerolineales bacterium]